MTKKKKNGETRGEDKENNCQVKKMANTVIASQGKVGPGPSRRR